MEELEFQVSFEYSLFKILNILIIGLSVILFLILENKYLALILLILFPLVRTIFIKKTFGKIEKGQFIILDKKLNKLLEDEKVLNFSFYQLSQGLKGSKRVEVTSMEEDSYPCYCQVEYRRGVLIVEGVDYLIYQFLNHILINKKK